MSGSSQIKLIIVAVLAIILLILSFFSIEITTVHGSEIGVKETWSEGVLEISLPAKTYVLFPGFNQSIYTYSLAPQIFVMNDNTQDERANGRDHDAYVAKSKDNQSMTMDLCLQWHFDPTKIVDIHKRYNAHNDRDNWAELIEETEIRQNLMAAVNTAATSRTAIDAYSGDGFVSMQSQIFNALTNPTGELRSRGIVVETFVIEQIRLDPAYIGEINNRQVAQQRKLRADAEKEAADAEALKAKAEAQADYNRRLVEASRDKEVAVLRSEGEAQQAINAANASAQQVVLAANAERDAALARAAAIQAIGEAEAKANELKMQSFSSSGSESFVRIEVAKQMAIAFQNVKGYLPSDMDINLLSNTFMNAIDTLMNSTKSVAPVNTPAPIRSN